MHLDKTTIDNLKRDRNILAASLSIVPGLGHIYKGCYGAGFAILLLGAPLCLWIGILLSLATAGVGLLFPLGVWAAVVIDAYFRKNHRRHHWFGIL